MASASKPAWVIDISFNIARVARMTALSLGAIATLGLAYYLGYTMSSSPGRRKKRDPLQNQRIEDIVGRLRLNHETLTEVRNVITEEVNKALSGVGDSELKMIPVGPYLVPNKLMDGKYLTMDLGGTNFYIAEVEIHEDGNIEELNKMYDLPSSLFKDRGELLFEYLVECLADFMVSHNLAYRKNKLPLAFCFSFPCQVNSLKSAVLIKWSKGIRCSDTIGRDVGKMLQDAMDKNDATRVDVLAVANDTVCCMLSCAYRERNCMIGAILGSGVNVCYVEDTASIKKKRHGGVVDQKNEKTIINVELGGFGDKDGLDFLVTKYDKYIDRNSQNPGEQKFEKLISKMYIGDLAWSIIKQLMDEGLLFRGMSNKIVRKMDRTQGINKPCFLTSQDLLEIQESGVAFNKTQALLQEIGINDASYDDCAIVKYVCDLVAIRSAQLTGAALAAFINHIAMDGKVVVAIDGTLYRQYERYRQNLDLTIARLVERNLSYKLVLNEGSAKGLAILTSMTEAESCKPKPDNATLDS